MAFRTFQIRYLDCLACGSTNMRSKCQVVDGVEQVPPCWCGNPDLVQLGRLEPPTVSESVPTGWTRGLTPADVYRMFGLPEDGSPPWNT